jgi:hypothetical protein
MKSFRLRDIVRAILIAFFVGAVVAAPPAAYSQDSAATLQIKTIDTDCMAIQNATMALQPVHLALVQSKWTVLSDADYAVAQQTRASIVLVAKSIASLPFYSVLP